MLLEGKLVHRPSASGRKSRFDRARLKGHRDEGDAAKRQIDSDKEQVNHPVLMQGRQSDIKVSVLVSLRPGDFSHSSPPLEWR